MGGNTGCVHREQAYHIPEEIIEYVSGLLETPPTIGNAESDLVIPKELEETEEVTHLKHEMRVMRLKAAPEVSFGDEQTEEDVVEELIRRSTEIVEPEKGTKVRAVKMGPETHEVVDSDLAKQLKQALIEEFGKTSLSGKYQPDPPERGPFGMAEIWLKPDAIPVSVTPYLIIGEKGRALADLVAKCE